jgi:hypothetical protein
MNSDFFETNPDEEINWGDSDSPTVFDVYSRVNNPSHQHDDEKPDVITPLPFHEPHEIFSKFRSLVINPREGSLLAFLSKHGNRNNKAIGGFFKSKIVPVLVSGFLANATAPVTNVLLLLVMPRAQATELTLDLVDWCKKAFPDIQPSKSGTFRPKDFDKHLVTFLLNPDAEDVIEDISEVLPKLKELLALKPEVATFLMGYLQSMS